MILQVRRRQMSIRGQLGETGAERQLLAEPLRGGGHRDTLAEQLAFPKLPDSCKARGGWAESKLVLM